MKKKQLKGKKEATLKMDGPVAPGPVKELSQSELRRLRYLRLVFSNNQTYDLSDQP
jgi:hypothetical protein